MLSGIFIGALYGLLGLGLSLSWGLLRQINLAHFALAFLGGVSRLPALARALDPLADARWSSCRCSSLIGMAMQWVFARFRVSPFNSLLVTFGLTVIIEAMHPGASGRRTSASSSRRTATAKFKVGAFYVPVPELMTLVVARRLALAIWACMRYTDLGRALRATAEDGPMAAAFGMNEKRAGAGARRRLRGFRRRRRRVHRAHATRSAPSQIYAWIGVVFAAVMLGGLGGAHRAARRRASSSA